MMDDNLRIVAISTAACAATLTLLASARAVWDLLAQGARLHKGPWATPHSYLLWWTLCINLHSPCINESAVKDQVNM